MGGPRRVDGEALRLGIFAERGVPDAELDTERTHLPSLLDRLFCWYTEVNTNPEWFTSSLGVALRD